jgi:SAM-dependent methyltransferase
VKKDQWTSGPAYDEWMGRWSALLAAEFLAWLAPSPGLRWLDVCCGSGILSLAIAERSAPTSVKGVDFSEPQLAFARGRRAHPRITYEFADATALPFGPESFDVAVSGLGLNFVPEPVRAVSEMRRVTVPGGIIAGYVWDYSGGARFLREFWDAALAVDPTSASFDQGTRFALCAPEKLQATFEAVRLEQCEVRPLDIITRFESFESYWAPFSLGQGSAPVYLQTRGAHIRDAIRARLESSFPRDPNGSISLPARAWAIRART